MTTAETPARLELIDYLRLVAAATVLCYHWLYNGIANGKVDSITHTPLAAVAQYGYLGVDLFFLISGYVIAKSALGKTPRRFAVGRAVRLYPAFWVAMPITAIFATFLGGPLMSVTPLQVLANFTMVSTILRQPYVDGVYWTLLLELAFYAAVFLVLLLRLGRWLDTILSVWALGMAAVALFAPTLATLPFLGGHFALFASGAIISAIARGGWTPLRAISLAAGFGTVVAFELRDAVGIDYPVIIGLTIAMYAAIMSTLNRRVARLRLPGSQAAGQLTYPLYLLHAHIGYMLIDTFATESNRWFVYAAVLVFIVALAWTLHVAVERRRFWYPFLDHTLGAAVGVLERAVPTRTRRAPVR